MTFTTFGIRFAVSLALLVAMGCGTDSDSDAACIDASVTCVDDETFMLCDDGELGEEQTCPTGEACMEMDGGAEMCMDPMGM